jgi:hypothetical protein
MKIAFLFLTIDNINHPLIWEKYFDKHKDKYTIYCHPKYPNNVTIPWLKKNIITNLANTEWGYITEAYYNLFNEAYKDENNFKFITVSESCLPLRNFNKLYNKLINDNINTSYIKFMNISNYDKKERIMTQKNYKKYNFKKHYARCCLSRFHTKLLLDKKHDFTFFNKMHVGDEFFLSLLHPYDNVVDFEITYDNWDYVKEIVLDINNKIKLLYEDTEKNNNNNIKEIKLLQTERDNIRKNPKSYLIVSEKDILELRHKNIKSFFWRKFPKNSNIEQLYDVFKFN